MNRGRLLLVLVLLLCGALLYAWKTTPRQRRVASSESLTTARIEPLRETATPDSDHQDLHLAREKPATFPEPQKNLFGPVFRPSPPPKPKTIKRPPPRPKPVKREPPPPKVKPQPVTLPDPLPPLKVLGYLDKSDRKIVFLSSRGIVYLVREGESFADDLQVKGIGRNSITIVRSGTDQQLVLRTGEARTQRLPNQSPQGRARSIDPLPQSDPAVEMPPPPEDPGGKGQDQQRSPEKPVRQQPPENPLLRSIDEI